jgi:release factor glutamine methyltransferase
VTRTVTETDIRAAGQALTEAGIENGLQEARWIHDHLSEQDDPPHLNAFMNLIERRQQREPLQHILGSWAFFDLDLKTDARALIPRADTEPVIELALRRLGLTVFPAERSDRTITIADLGTGSGAILATLLSRFPEASGIAVEANKRALSLAEENFSALGLLSRIELVSQSWTDWAGWYQCDLIISNPPYVKREVISTLAPEVRDHDPIDALDGGVDGLDAYREIIALAQTHMRPGAELVFEIGFDQKQQVSDLLLASGFENLEHMQDLGGHDRGIAATKS